MTTTGQRKPDGTKPWELDGGDYAMRGENLWVVLPNGAGPACLEGWDVTQHEDGTITVSPSILDHGTGWHGFLEHGEWREA